MGLTGVSFKHYNMAHVGMIPGTLAYCFIGGTVGAIGDSVGFTDPVVLSVTIVGTVLAIVGMVYISWVAKKEFNKIANQQRMIDGDIDMNNMDGIPNETGDDAYAVYNPPRRSTTNGGNDSDSSASLSLGN